MSPSLRKLIGMLIILVGLSAYIIGAITLGTTVVPGHWAAQLAFYAVSGVIWALPLKPLIAWINGGSPAD